MGTIAIGRIAKGGKSLISNYNPKLEMTQQIIALRKDTQNAANLTTD